MAATIIELEQVGSTNDWLSERAGQGAGDNLWVRAKVQLTGRGRRGRPWASAPGNLFLSVLVRPRPGEIAAQQLSFVSVLALDEALQGWTSRDRISLKWPNDLLLDGQKLAGILLEAAPGGGTIIGFGVNLTSSPPDLDRPAISLLAAGIEPPAPAVLAAELAATFERWRERWRQQGFAPVRSAWMGRAAHAAGASLIARLGNDTIVGRFEEVDAGGALVLRMSDGAVRQVHAGEVFGLDQGGPPLPRAKG